MQQSRAGFDPSKIAFAGVGKSDSEISNALEAGIFCFNCESIPEIEVIEQIAAKKKKTAQIALRINPLVDAHTHKYITTGIEESKFGIHTWELDNVLKRIVENETYQAHWNAFPYRITDNKNVCISEPLHTYQ